MKGLPALLFALLVLPVCADEFEFHEEIHSVLALDLNGDGKKELVCQTGHRLTIHFYRGARGYSLRARALFALPDDIALYAFGDVDGKPGPELVGLGAGEVRAWRFTKNDEGLDVIDPAPLVLLTVPTAFETTTLDVPRPRDFLLDLDGDADLDLVVPRPGFFALYTQVAPGVFELAQKITIETEATISMGGGSFQNNIVRAVSFPRFWLADFDADGRSDFFYFRGPTLIIHQRVADGLFSSSASRVFNFNKFVKKRRRRRELFDYFSAVSPEITDVNADKRADVAIMLPGKGKVGVFLGGGEKPYSEGQVVQLGGWTFRREGIPMLRDLNNDGRPDLVLLNIPQLGFWDILEIFFSRKIEVKTFFYLAQPNGSFGMPDHTYTVSVPLILSVTRDSQRLETPFLMTVDGDVNGDGLKDLVVKSGTAQLQVSHGQSSGVFSRTPDKTITLSVNSAGMASEPPLVADLDGDGLDDIILHHQDFERKLYLVEILLMRRQ